MAPPDPVHSEGPEPRDLGQKIPEPVEETKEERVCESNERQEEAASPAIKTEPEEKEEQVVCEYVYTGGRYRYKAGGACILYV